MTRKNAFLTDKKRRLLGPGRPLDWSDESKRVKKSEIRRQSDMALDELIKVAASGKISNPDTFNPDKIAKLLDLLFKSWGKVHSPHSGAIFHDPRQEEIDIIPPEVLDELGGDEEQVKMDYNAKTEAFRKDLLNAVENSLNEYEQMESADPTTTFGGGTRSPEPKDDEPQIPPLLPPGQDE